MARGRLHIICGNCGCKDEFRFKIEPEGKDIDGVLSPAVFIRCDNCATLTSLDDFIPETLE